MMTQEAMMRDLHLQGATGEIRVEKVGDLDYVVVPVVALMEGVIHAVNAETPEFVPATVLQKAAESWNGKPVTLGHPRRNGTHCSANHPDVLEAHGIGVVKNSRMQGKKMLCEAWIEQDRAKRLHPEMYERLMTGQREEVSVGALVRADENPGLFNNKPYKGSWQEASGDHLAFLPGGRGACSIEMGCGAHRAAMMHLVTAEGFEALGGPGSGNFGHKGRPGQVGGSAGKGGKGGGGKLPDHDPDWMNKLPSEANMSPEERKAKRDEANKKFEEKLEREAKAEDWAADYVADNPESALDLWMDSERKAELHDIVQSGGKVKSFSTSIREKEDEEGDKLAKWEAARTKTMEKRGFELFAQEDNYDTHEMVFVKRAKMRGAEQAKDCPTCGGTGQVKKDDKQADCEACEGSGKIRVAEMVRALLGARNSSKDMAMIQGIHDHAASLGAVCGRHRLMEEKEKKRIRHEGGAWVLYSRDLTRRLGSHDTEAEAIERMKKVDARVGEAGGSDAATGAASCGCHGKK